MINSDLTLYHKKFDDVNKIEIWEKHYYPYIWWYGRTSASVNQGYVKNKSLDVRIWYDKNENLNIEDFALGDIIIQGEHDDIECQQDLIGLDFYNITSISNNTNGNSKHIHLGGS